MKKILFSVLAVALLWSCGKDDGPVTPTEGENSVPVIAAKTFTVAETISDTEVIGKVTATDADKDALTFSIATNDGDLFEITKMGDLSLASGKTLDAATKEQHAITVKVDDGEDTASATITIKVTAVAPTNQAPEMADQEFTAKEDITDANEIGEVKATDADGDTLTFTIAQNDNDLFVVSDTGILTLAEGKALDYETATSHSITVSVTDGEETVDATMTITVENLIESIAEDPDSFVTTWKTTANNQKIRIGVDPNYEYDFTVDWGDSTIEGIIQSDVNFVEHIYESPGTYTVAIAGGFPAIKMSNGNPKQLMSIEQWGSNIWESLSVAFQNCTNMVYNATDLPNLSNITDMSGMFAAATSFNGNISGWDTSEVTNMTSMFVNAISFDQNLGSWNIQKVEKMINMFDASGMSALNFSNTLLGWAEQEVMPNVSVGAAFVNICENGEGLNGFNILSNEPNNWTITFGGLETCD
jgi:surface protein